MSQKPKEVPIFGPEVTPDQVIDLDKRIHTVDTLKEQETDFQIARRLIFGLFDGVVDRLRLGQRAGVTDEKIAQKFAPVKEKVSGGATGLYFWLNERIGLDNLIQRGGERVADFFRNLGNRLNR